MTSKGPAKVQWIVYGVLIAGAVLVPFFIKDNYLIHLLIVSIVWANVVTNWNLTLGYGGMFHIAQPCSGEYV